MFVCIFVRVCIKGTNVKTCLLDRGNMISSKIKPLLVVEIEIGLLTAVESLVGGVTPLSTSITIMTAGQERPDISIALL